MANQTVYPYGTEGSLPSSIGLVNDLRTGGVDKALTAEMGKYLDSEINNFLLIDISATSNTKAFISYPGNTWVTTSTSYYCKFFSVLPGESYIIKANAARYSYVAVLKNTSRVNGGTPNFATGCACIRMEADSTQEISVPSDGYILYVAAINNGNDCLPQSIARAANRSEEAEMSIMLINSRKIDNEPLHKYVGWMIDADNIWQHPTDSSADNFVCVLIPISPGSDYLVSGNTTGGVAAILSSDYMVKAKSPDFSTSYQNRISVGANKILSFTAPQDAAYLYLAIKSGTGDKDIYAASPMPIADQLAEMGNGGGKDGFENAPEYYAWKKAEQMLNLKWTPLKAVPKSTTGNFSANTEQTGTPYSSVAEYDKRVGEDVSIYTFMTALHNPYSLIYTENVRYSTSQSAYGIQYYGPSNCAMYYGVVCSGYTSYSLGTIPYTTGQFADLAEQGIYEKVYDQSAQGVKRGDLLWQEGHVLLVHDIWRKNGVVTNVLVTEQWQPLARVRGLYDASGFNSFLASEHITIYRYKELYKNIHYIQSPFVTVGDETPLPEVTYNDDICTFAGDRVTFLEGDLIYIHCLNLNYPQMEIYKDDILVETITVASDLRAALTSDQLAYAVNLSNDNLEYGMYKCRLKDGSTYSDFTYFEVIRASVTVDEQYVATYSSPNANAVFHYWQAYHSPTGGKIYNMTALDGKKSGTIDVSDRMEGRPLLKVLFRGEYGRVAARWLDES